MKWTKTLPKCEKKSVTDKGNESDTPYLCFLKWGGDTYTVRFKVLFPYREVVEENGKKKQWLSWFDESGNVYYTKGYEEASELVVKWVNLSDLTKEEKKEFELK